MRSFTLSKPVTISPRFTRLAFFAAAVLFLSCVAILTYAKYYNETDWYAYRDATLAMLHGQTNPPGMYNPPWTYIPLIPLALLPPAVGAGIIAPLCYIVYWFVSRKLGADTITTLIFLSTPQLFFLSHLGSIDWLIPIGFILPPWLGLFFVLAKPQIGIGIAVYWGFMLLRERGFWHTFKTFAPVTVCYIAFWIVYRPNWTSPIGSVWDVNMWPYCLPFGLALLVYAIRKRDLHLSILVSPLLAPYIGYYSIPASLLGLSKRKWEMIAAVAGMWFIWFVVQRY